MQRKCMFIYRSDIYLHSSSILVMPLTFFKSELYNQAGQKKVKVDNEKKINLKRLNKFARSVLVL